MEYQSCPATNLVPQEIQSTSNDVELTGTDPTKLTKKQISMHTIVRKDENGNVICEEAVEIQFGGRLLRLSLIMEPDDLMPLFDGCGWAGSMVWQASVVMAEYLSAQYVNTLVGASLVELGCGCGLPGMIARVLGAGTVILTEQEGLIPLIQRNLRDNFPQQSEIHAEELDWSSENASRFKQMHSPIDFLVCCDCIYEPLYGESWRSLAETICVLQSPKTKIIVSVERRTADGVENFMLQMKNRGFQHLCVEKVDDIIEVYEFFTYPDNHTTNELVHDDEEGAKK